MDHIAISHLHGDHYLGLPGLISTFNLLGRTRALNVYGPPELEEILAMHFRVGEGQLEFPLNFMATQSEAPAVLFEDATVILESFPVRHRIPTTGFLIREKPREPGIKKEWVRRFNLIPSEILTLKKGEDVLRSDGQIIASDEACHPAPEPRSYAFSGDTKYWERIPEFVSGVSLLYHEATFDDSMKERAVKTYHSTASQAARVAKQADVGALILGHISARYASADLHLEQARAIFPHVVVAEDGAVFEVRHPL